MNREVPIIYYNELNENHINKKYARVLSQLQQGDFAGAEVKKMVNSHFYRARLDEKDRLLFTWIDYKGSKYLLLLELITNHEYQKSRFLRGGIIPDESQWLPLKNTDVPANVNISYLNNKDTRIHALNKFISFDADQADIYRSQLPMVLIGSAGSGKTVLVLEKMKQLPGHILYTSLSKYLVDNARQLYFANGYENEEQEIDFLSFNQYMNLWQQPQGREIKFQAFSGWFFRNAQTLKFTDARKLFEEFNGVITGQCVDKEYFSYEEYMTLGIRQSVYTEEERKLVYQMFKRYLEWLQEDNYYDNNMLAHRFLEQVQPCYDYIVIDEVQDITNAQLQFILKSLNSKNGFILTGDSNQIVHPNFFSWAAIKTFFYTGGKVTLPIHILHTNYRNSERVVQISNRLLTIKNTRFGSIDKESNYLIKTNSALQGEILLLHMNEKVLRDLNQRTVQSAAYAVIVPTEADKTEVAKIFKTPLLFSVHEAKGLEYENVILVNFVSKHNKEFNDISESIDKEAIDNVNLNYARPADKNDKEGEVYKFYINSLYVALTRALTNIYMLEQQPNHYTLQLLGLAEYKAPVNIQVKQSTKEEWLDEAERLEAQGKIEQAEQIRAKVLGYDYMTAEELEKVKIMALDPAKKEQEVKRERKLLYSYAVNNNRIEWVEQLANLQFQRAMLYMKEIRAIRKEYSKNCRLGRLPELLPVVKKYGADFVAEEDGTTGITVALVNNQAAVAIKLREMKASLTISDKGQWLAFHHMVNGYLRNKILKQTHFTDAKILTQFWHIAKPAAVKVTTGGQLKNLPGHRLYTLIFWLMQCFEEEKKAANERAYKEQERYVQTANQNQKEHIKKLISNLDDKIAYVQQGKQELADYNFGVSAEQSKAKQANYDEEIQKLRSQKKIYEDSLPYLNRTSLMDENLKSYKIHAHYTIDDILNLVSALPNEILPEDKKKRTVVSGILSGHEAGGSNPYNKALFKRIERGVYSINQGLEMVG